jgi:alcohol dehydrogenase (cytochrome c)
VDYQRKGRTIKGLVDVARDGYVWFLDRSSLARSSTSGNPLHIGFVEAKPYVYGNVFKSIDPVSGRPDEDSDHKPGTGKRADFCPGTHGGKTWPPIAFSPKTRMIYIPANNNMCSSNMGAKVQYTPGKGFVGITGSHPFTVPGADHFGEVQAWNIDTGQNVWTHKYAKSPNWGSMLATAGGLVFSGGTNDRKFHAFDATTGELLWEFPTNSGVEAPPTSFLIDRKQYIAIESGWGGDSRSDQNSLNRLFPGEFPEVPEGGAVWVFAVQ